jgi:hypothetical protein
LYASLEMKRHDRLFCSSTDASNDEIFNPAPEVRNHLLTMIAKTVSIWHSRGEIRQEPS